MTRLHRMALLLVCGCLALAPAAALAKPATADTAPTKTATFAGGCFWCMEEAFESVPGVRTVTSGYIGGHVAQPSYKQVSAGQTGHAEAVQVQYDPTQVSYDDLLEVFWHNIDPLTPNAQFCDHGSQYRAAIFYHDDEQKRLAEASKQALVAAQRFDQPIVTQIEAATTFYEAEDYHQDYYKNPLRYKFYKYACGRAKRLRQLWE